MVDRDEHTLLLLRHAEAEPFAPGRRDPDRALTESGHDQARAVGVDLGHRGLRPDVVLCSSSRRTRQTLDDVLAGAGFDVGARFDVGAGVEINYLDAVYNAGSDTLRTLLTELAVHVHTVLLVGHAPGVPRLARELAGPGSDRAASAALEHGFPTASLAGLTLASGWAALAEDGVARLDWLRAR